MTSLTASSPLANSRFGMPHAVLTPRISSNCVIEATNCGRSSRRGMQSKRAGGRKDKVINNAGVKRRA